MRPWPYVFVLDWKVREGFCGGRCRFWHNASVGQVGLSVVDYVWFEFFYLSWSRVGFYVVVRVEEIWAGSCSIQRALNYTRYLQWYHYHAEKNLHRSNHIHSNNNLQKVSCKIKPTITHQKCTKYFANGSIAVP